LQALFAITLGSGFAAKYGIRGKMPEAIHKKMRRLFTLN
jgi:hypothetical protein